MLWEQRVRYAAQTDIGFRRKNNQDSCAVALCSLKEEWEEGGHLFVVADGMGGHAVGELASKIATDTIPHMFAKLRGRPPAVALKIAIEEANDVINERGSQNHDFMRMGTTCSTLVLCPQGAIIGHVGDSRVYRIRNSQIDQLTSDHSLLWEMIQSRKLNQKDAERLCPRNVITRSLGPEPNVDVDIEGPFPVEPGDIFLLCSDGLSGLLSDSEIGMIAGTVPPNEACRLLVNLSNLRGGPDNITVIIVHTGDLPEGVDVVYERPVPPSRFEGLSWGGFALMCVFAALFLVGLYFFELDKERRLQGGAILATAALAGIAYWTWHRSRHFKNGSDYAPNSAVDRRPYREAPARITDAFVEQITHLEADLQQAAIEDHWPVDWPSYEEAFRRARDAVEKRLFTRALVEYGRLFDLLMAAIQQQRKLQLKEQRPKKGSGPSISTIKDAT
ncbi:PP2C family protein-serine/threonine phosphatase [Schlesneria sp. T3-172]|uniref:PP2C family protein-serine/threonine phosphatase n=1 Tax=Schlesneria sphaerica TaxID=3373610 RepID=UPI0037C6C697